MIDFSADHIGFVIACYAITVVVLGALLIYTFARARAVEKRLETFERSGASRRKTSSGSAS